MDDRLKYLISEYKDACSISTKPISIKKLPTGHIEDENKSVKWNREFLENNNKKYIEAVANLQRERSLKMNDVQKRIEKYIKDKTGVNSKGAKAIFDFAYSEGHSFGIEEVGRWIDDLCELFLECKE